MDEQLSHLSPEKTVETADSVIFVPKERQSKLPIPSQKIQSHKSCQNIYVNQWF